MSKTSVHTRTSSRPRPAVSVSDIYAIPILALIFALIAGPLLYFYTFTPSTVRGLMETRNENKIVWPALAALAVIFAARKYRGKKIVLPPHMMIFLAYLAFAGASILWAYKPEFSFVRYAQQVMVVTSIVLPGLLLSRKTDLLHGMFLCFGLAVVLNIYFVAQGYQTITDRGPIGYQGYFIGKNYLGGFSAIAFLLALHEMLYSGRRRVLGFVIAVIAFVLIVLANSKTALGLAIVTPFLGAMVLVMRRTTGLSPVVVPIAAVVGYFILSSVSNFSMARLSYMLYGDPTFTGRQMIWDFAIYEIARRPLLGWGYQGFWLIGPDAPSVVEAPGWVKTMPNAHSGYYDTILELGYVGFILLLAFIGSTLHALGRVADREPKRAWILLSLFFYVLISNGLESIWMRGFEVLWLVFLIIAVEAARSWQPLPRLARGAQPQRRSPQVSRRPSHRPMRPGFGGGGRIGASAVQVPS